MSDPHHHHQHRPHRLSVPSRTTTTTSRSYPLYPYSTTTTTTTTPLATPSKHRLSSIPSFTHRSNTTTSSLSFLFLLLFSLRSLYSLLPFLRSSPSFSLFPFSFLVSLSSFLLTLSFSLFSSTTTSPSKDPFNKTHSSPHPISSFSLISQSQFRLLIAKSILLAVVFLLRFQALRYCGTAATILAEFSGNVAARFFMENSKPNSGYGDRNYGSKVRGFFCLFIGLLLLSISWDRVECFPLSFSNVGKGGVLIPGVNCVRVWPMLLPFLSGFLGCYEKGSINWGSIKQLGRKRVRLISLLFTTIVLFFPALISIFMFEGEGGDGVSIGSLGWPLANTVVFGVLLSENFSEQKFLNSKDYHREYIVTFVCTLVLELFYFPELSLWGLLLCGFLLWISVRELDPIALKYPELGSVTSESFSSMIMKPIRHIMSERKSRKIALFLFINTAYMVVEFVVGFMSNSLGLISDACHMLFDCAALAIGLYASYISRLPANSQFTYGRGRFEVLSGYVNAVFLVLVGVLIVLESFERILDPQEISTGSLLTVSVGGLVVNVVGLIFFHEEHHHAHAGAGSCSHSHSHSHSHLHSHDLAVHDHHECISVSHEKSSVHHESHCDDHPHHNHEHDDSHLHSHHHQSHGDHHDHGHKHDHHDHGHKHDHHDHDHGHTHGHHDHGHTDDCHDHGYQHDHHDRKHHDDEYANHNSLRTSSSLSKHSHEGHSHGKSHSHSESCGYAPLKESQKQHRHIDHNMEGIFLHVLADTLGSVGVVVSTLLIKYKGWLISDPACSIVLSIMIISSVIPLLRNSAEVLLQRVPRAHEQDLKVALDDVARVSGVHGVQNVHVWSFTNTDVVGTLHLIVSADADKVSTKARVSNILHNAGIKDLTIQMDYVIVEEQ